MTTTTTSGDVRVGQKKTCQRRFVRKAAKTKTNRTEQNRRRKRENTRDSANAKQETGVRQNVQYSGGGGRSKRRRRGTEKIASKQPRVNEYQ